MTFSGSYLPEDIIFLLEPTQISLTPLAEKEKNLQKGLKHYSEMLGMESPPTPMHMRIYHQAMKRNADRLANDIMGLARIIEARHTRGSPITLASLARAGCPLGVLLKRALKILGYEANHFGISIIRDRGIDQAAWNVVRKSAPAENIFFVDGWTGKGAIAGELLRSHGPLRNPLVVLADPCGMADFSASHEDWLIPFGILGATISGLISRTLWSERGYHKCMLWESMKELDVSRTFVEDIASLMNASACAVPEDVGRDRKEDLQNRTGLLVKRLMREYGLGTSNLVKPGIAEATRAVLRRVPDKVLISRPEDPDLELLLYLAEQNSVEVRILGEDILPYKAITIIKKAGKMS